MALNRGAKLSRRFLPPFPFFYGFNSSAFGGQIWNKASWLIPVTGFAKGKFLGI
jgi:hypothetical protein